MYLGEEEEKRTNTSNEIHDGCLGQGRREYEAAVVSSGWWYRQFADSGRKFAEQILTTVLFVRQRGKCVVFYFSVIKHLCVRTFYLFALDAAPCRSLSPLHPSNIE